MNRRKKLTLRLALTVAVVIGAITLLEILSRTWSCPSSSTSASFAACDHRLHADDEELKKLLGELSEKYSQGIPPSQEEMEKAVIEIDRESIGGANGVYCNAVAFVSNDLPAQAELYVRRHELEHAFQITLQMQLENRESAANYAAAKEYPIGIVQTVVFSIVESRSSSDSVICYLIGLWQTFKAYFLPFAVS